MKIIIKLLLAPFRFLSAIFKAVRRWYYGEMIEAKEKVVRKRRWICGTCPSGEKNDFCRECFCNIKLKTYFADEKCPLNKW